MSPMRQMATVLALLCAVVLPGAARASEPSDPSAQRSVHALHSEWFGRAGELPLLAPPSAPAPARHDRSGVKPCATVFGFLPYWQRSASVRWDLLTHVACFDVEVNADGSLSNPNAWPWTSTINAARAANVRVLVTLTNFSPSSISALLNSPGARSALFTNVANLIRTSADGVVIDFEGTNSPQWQSQMPQFVTDLKGNVSRLLSGRSVDVFVASPAVNWAGSAGWNFGALADAADGLFLMGYDFYGSWSTTSGPSAPLTGGSFNVTNSVLAQYANVVAARPHKLVLGVPYYGNRWEAASSSAYASATRFVGSVVYSSAASQSAASGLLWDASSQTPWTRWQAAAGGVWNQTWFDDAQSLRLKYRLAKSHGLAGVGMWALGYDGSRTELWDLITDEFVTPCACPADFNRVDGVSVQDLFDFLAAWFAGCVGQPGSPCFTRSADMDASGALGTQDLFNFLSAWFAGC